MHYSKQGALLYMEAEIFVDSVGFPEDKLYECYASKVHTILKLLINTVVQYNTIQYNTIQYNTIQYNTIQYNTIQYNSSLFVVNGHRPKTQITSIKQK